jgi:hypothetical protein
MCIITDEIKEVTNTEILVGINKDQKEQLTVYSNKTINYTPNNFMILPVPTDISDQIRFIDLTGIEVFSKLEQLFKPEFAQSYGMLSTNSLGKGDIEYHSVGSYDVFVCKTLQSIINNFSVNAKVMGLLGKYYANGFAFLLCKLKSGKEFKYHPLAYVHKIRHQDIFIPTKHLHIHRQGEDYEKNYEYWDHHIYVYNYQGNLGFKNQVLVEVKDEIDRIIQEYKNENYFKLLGDVDKPKMKFEDRVKIISTIGLPTIPWNHDKVHSINRFVVKNVFLNDDLMCSVY